MKRSVWLTLFCALWMIAWHGMPVHARPQSTQNNTQAQAPALDVRNADIRVFIQDVARATGLTFIVDPRVQGTVSLSRAEAMSESELLGVLMALLRGNGLIAVANGPKTYRVVPDDTAARQPRSAGDPMMHFATRVFELSHVDARVAAKTIKPLVGRGGVVVATQGNGLLVADYVDNLRRIAGLIAQIDSNRASIDTVTLRNSSAAEIAATINDLFALPGAEGGSSAVLSVLPVESSNSIVVRGDPALIQRVVQMALELDQRAQSTGDVRVIKLRHASAEKLLPVLQQLVGAGGATTPDDSYSSSATGGAAAASQPTIISATPGRRPTIVRAPGQNALLINADPETQRTLMEVIKQLDVRRKQVLVEAIVVEISDNAASELGAQIAAFNRDGVPFATSQFHGAGPGITELAGAALLEDDPDDDSDLADVARNAALQSLLGLTGGLAGLAGSAGDTLFGLIINAVKSDTGSNLLSTPSILTLDNEPARILVGQNVPLTTGEVLGDGNANPFRTIEREDVGIELEVTPQINAGGGIILELRQEVSSIAGPVSADFDELILNKREVETRVLVDNGAIVVLGGLLDQAERSSVDKVPFLGDIPILGSLFRSTSRSKAKTNLMIFIRPTIIGGPEDAQRTTAPRYDYMRKSQLQLDDGKRREAALDVLVRDYLHAHPPVAPRRRQPAASATPAAPATDVLPPMEPATPQSTPAPTSP